MSYFKGLKLTKLGETLLANINGNLNETLTFTSGEIGAGTINGDDEIRFLTSLKEKWKDLEIISIEKDPSDETIVKLELQFSNIDLKEAKIFREIGIYAKGNNGEPILFAYSNAGENYDYIPLPQDNPQNFTIEINLKITSNSKIDAIINMAGFVTIGKMLEFLKNKLTQIPTIAELQLRKNLKVGDIVEVLGYYAQGDGAGHKRIISNTAKGFNSITLKNGLYANLIKDSDIKNIILKQTNEYADIKYELVKKVSEKISLKKINNKFIFSYNDELSGHEKQTIYIKSLSSNTGVGNSMTYPITLNQFKKNLESGLYTKLILEVIMLDEIIFDKELCGILSFTNNHIEIKSFVKGGTWITSCDRMTYENTNENILVYNSSAQDRIAHIVEYGTKDNYDIPILLKKVSDEINLKKGTWCISQGKIKVYPYDIKNTDSIYAVLLSATGFEMTTGSKHITLENINFLIHQSNKGSCTIRNTSSTIHPLYIFKNCKFLGGEQDSLSLNGRYRSAVVDCVAAYGNKDCFNYHTQSKDSIVMEVNCIGYGAGMNKTSTGNQTQHSNNATTAHDGMTIYRFGSVGFNCEGPVLADVNGCKSINIDCVMGISTTIKGYNSNYHYQSDFNNYNEFILINCKNSIIGDKGTLQNKGVHVIGDCKFICDFNDNITNKIDISDVSLNNVYKAGAINE